MKVIEMNIRKENGLTLVGFLIALSVVLFFAYAGMRIVPMYLEYHALGNALAKLEEVPTRSVRYKPGDQLLKFLDNL